MRWPLLILGFASLVGVCASSPVLRVAQPPSPQVIELRGYDEAVQLGTYYAQQMGYARPAAEDASPYGTNFWRIQFGLEHSLTGPHFVIGFGKRPGLTKKEELAGVRAIPTVSVVPPKPAF
jgi:hypothetical protein